MPTEKTPAERRERPARDEPETPKQEPRQFGGTRVDEEGRVTYTHEGAVSATPGGPIDPTIDPEAGQPPVTGEVIDREDVEGLTGEHAEREAKDTGAAKAKDKA